MTVQPEHLYVAFPYRLAPKNLFDGHAFEVAGIDTMQSLDYLSQLI